MWSLNRYKFLPFCLLNVDWKKIGTVGFQSWLINWKYLFSIFINFFLRKTDPLRLRIIERLYDCYTWKQHKHNPVTEIRVTVDVDLKACQNWIVTWLKSPVTENQTRGEKQLECSWRLIFTHCRLIAWFQVLVSNVSQVFVGFNKKYSPPDSSIYCRQPKKRIDFS